MITQHVKFPMQRELTGGVEQEIDLSQPFSHLFLLRKTIQGEQCCLVYVCDHCGEVACTPFQRPPSNTIILGGEMPPSQTYEQLRHHAKTCKSTPAQ